MKFSFLKSLTKKSAIYFAGMVTTIGLATAYAAWPAGVDTLVHKTAGDPVPSTDWNTIVDALKESKARIAALEAKPGGVDWTPNPAYNLTESNTTTFSVGANQSVQVSKTFIPQKSGMYYTNGNMIISGAYFVLTLKEIGSNTDLSYTPQYDTYATRNVPVRERLVHLKKGVQYAYYMISDPNWATTTLTNANYGLIHAGSDI